MSVPVEVTTYFLEMFECPPGPALETPDSATVVHESAIDATDYRRLYNDVGAQWLWYERDALSDEELGRLIRRPTVEIHSLHYGGERAGYVELQYQDDQQVQILYFGLGQGFIGRGLGPFFLDWSIRHAFHRPTRRLWVHTCSLDHPRALATYERSGFREYRRDTGLVRIPAAAWVRRS